MSRQLLSLDELLAQMEPERQAKLAAEQAEYDDPANVAKRAARRQAEFESGVRLGFHDADGNPLPQPDEDKCPECGEPHSECFCNYGDDDGEED